MKCPLCGNRMPILLGEYLYCENEKCTATWTGIHKALIRAILRKLKAEYERGHKQGVEDSVQDRPGGEE